MSTYVIDVDVNDVDINIVDVDVDVVKVLSSRQTLTFSCLMCREL